MMGEVVLSSLLSVDAVGVAGGRFLGSGRMGGVGRSIIVVLCCGIVLLGKMMIVCLVFWHACCRPGIRMFYRRP